MIFKFAFRELRRNWKLNLFFVLNLSLGSIGFLSVESLRSKIEFEMSANAKKLLGADLSFSSRRRITESEIKTVREILGPEVQETSFFEFFAMVASSQGSRLVLVKAIDQNFPFYGEVQLGSGRNQGPSHKNNNLFESPSAWVSPELLSQLNLELEKKLQLGQAEFTIRETIQKESAQTFRLGSLAPRIFIDRSLIEKTGLLQFGSTFTEAHLFQLLPSTDPEIFKSKIYSILNDPTLQVDTPKTASESAFRQLDSLGDYLGLAALVALIMASLGATYLYRLYLTQHLRDMAIYRSLGMRNSKILILRLVQMLILSLVSLIPTLLGATLFIPLLSQLLSEFFPTESSALFSISNWIQPVLRSTGVTVIGAVLITGPYLLQLRRLKPAELFREGKLSTDLSTQQLLWFSPALALFWILSVWQAKSFRTGSLFFVSLVVLVLVMSGVSRLVLSQLPRFINHLSWPFRLSLKSLSRRKNQSWGLFVALCLGSLLINLLPQIKRGIEADFSFNQKTKLPSLFLFDVQEDQLEGIQNFLSKEKIELLDVSPMVRARILSVNGESFERSLENLGRRTREEEAEARFRNRGINLSYREKLSDSEEITEGHPLSPAYNPERMSKPGISLEKRYAERLGLKIGDILIFDVQGVEIEGQVQNIRRVQWNSFRPNFFILMENGVINEAPKTFIAILPQLEASKKNQVLLALSKSFPNVSVIDVRQTVTDVLSLMEKMSWSLQLMAVLALITGYVVLFSIVHSQLRTRRWELNLLKILGAKFSQVRNTLIFEFSFLSFVAAFIGALLSLVLTQVLKIQIFDDTRWSVDVFWLVLSMALIPFFSGLVAYFSSRKVTQEKPLALLSEL